MIYWISSSSILILIVIAIRAIFKGHIKLKIQYALWGLVLLRLLVPVQLGNTQLSIENYFVPEELPIEFVETSQQPEETGNTEIIIESEPLENIEKQAVIQNHNKKLNTEDILFMSWLFGAAAVTLGIAVSNIKFYIRLRRSRKKIKIYAILPVYECRWLDTPCMFGLIKPSVYINGDNNQSNIKHVICHEIMHYKQGDHIWAALRALCLIIHWYNPLVWLAAVYSKQDGELACDEATIRALGEEERIEYGRTLIYMSCSGKMPILNMATSMKAGKRSIKERIEIIASKPRMRFYTVLCLLAVSVLAAACTFTGANDLNDEVQVPAEPSEEVNTEETEEIKRPLGKFYDRNKVNFNPEDYEGLAGTTEVFKEYIESGNKINLTIDLAFQQQAEALLDNALLQTGDSSSGAVVVVNVNTGEPLAIVSRGGNKNLALEGTYRPANLFLPCTAVAAMGTNIISPDQIIECTGSFDRYEQEGLVFQCEGYANGTHSGEQTLLTALEHGCQFFFYILGNDTGIDTTEEYARALGLGEHSGIELRSASGLMANREIKDEWRIGDTLEATAGQGLSLFTPIQLAEYCAALANGGNRYSASILHSMASYDPYTLYTRLATCNTYANINDEVYETIRQAMYNIANDSSSELKNWAAGQWEIAGMSNGDNTAGNRLYMGFAPFDKPKIAVVAVVENTQDEYAAEKLAREIVYAYQQLKEVSPW